MTWNWEPRSWRKSAKVALGIVTIWPIVYIGLFVFSMFSIILLLPSTEKLSNRNCGNVDLLQLDRKIKNGEIKQLTVRPREIAALDRVGDCEFTIAVTNESTRQEILTEARKIVDGRQRVEKIEEDATDRDELPAFAVVGFVGLMVVHMFSVLLMVGLMPLYIILAVKNEGLDQTMRIVWVVLLATIGMFVNPVYWYLYVWRKPPAASTPTDHTPRVSGEEIPTVS
jgi:hypothetical protein